jgi:hypothetical protein
MVGVINPNSTQTLAGQILAAKNAKSERAPGEQAPTAETSATPTPHVGSHGALTTGMIIGIVIGIVALVGVCAALCFFIGRHKSMKEALKRSDAVAMTKLVGVGGDMGQGSQKNQCMSSFPQAPSFTQPPQTPLGEYPQDFGSSLPAYGSPHMGHPEMNRSHASYQ